MPASLAQSSTATAALRRTPPHPPDGARAGPGAGCRYDMGRVQAGFMGLSVLPDMMRKFGMRASDADIDVYVYFWKCVGRQLGIADDFNLCFRGTPTAAAIVTELMTQQVRADDDNARHSKRSAALGSQTHQLSFEHVRHEA